MDPCKMVVSKWKSHNILIMMEYFTAKEIIRTSYNYNVKYDIVTYGGEIKNRNINGKVVIAGK